MKKVICIIAGGYPTESDPVYAFIKPVAMAMADYGVSCIVIAPHSISSGILKGKAKRPYHWIDYSDAGNKVEVFQPNYISFSKMKINGNSISTLLRDRAIRKCAKNLKYDILYGHFWDCAIAACKFAHTSIPVIAVTGESQIRVMDRYRKETVEKLLPKITGVISVSTKNLEESKILGLIKENVKTTVIPNAVNEQVFRPIDKNSARKRLGISKNEKVVSFVGSFSERKGVLRVIEAVEKLEDVKMILIGKGELIPHSNRIIFSGQVSHEEIPIYLSASDVFVLPTLAEGCCNAIVEALACGIPVISSNLSFNDDILDPNNSIRVNPLDVEEIAQAIEQVLFDKDIYKKLSSGALIASRSLTIPQRCKKIMEFLGV